VGKKNGIHYKIKSCLHWLFYRLGRWQRWNSFYEDIYKRDDSIIVIHQITIQNVNDRWSFSKRYHFLRFLIRY
jgi:hypothetical protein